VLKELSKLISNNIPAFVIGTNLIEGHWLQDTQDRCVLISEPVGGTGNFYVKDFAEKIFQIFSRSTTYYTARADIQTIYDWLHGAAGWDMPQVDGGPLYRLNTADAIQLPSYIGEDQLKRFLFSFNIRCFITKRTGS